MGVSAPQVVGGNGGVVVEASVKSYVSLISCASSTVTYVDSYGVTRYSSEVSKACCWVLQGEGNMGFGTVFSFCLGASLVCVMSAEWVGLSLENGSVLVTNSCLWALWAI